MSPEALLTDLARRGVRVIPDGGELVCRGPDTALDAATVAALRANKPALLALLASKGPAASMAAAVPSARSGTHWTPTPAGACLTCRGAIWWTRADGATFCERCRPPLGDERSVFEEDGVALAREREAWARLLRGEGPRPSRPGAAAGGGGA